jgi:hypothetical protein
LEKPTLDRMVTFGQYLDRIELSRAPFERSRLARRGALVEFDFVITDTGESTVRFAGS